MRLLKNRGTMVTGATRGTRGDAMTTREREIRPAPAQSALPPTFSLGSKRQQ